MSVSYSMTIKVNNIKNEVRNNINTDLQTKPRRNIRSTENRKTSTHMSKESTKVQTQTITIVNTQSKLTYQKRGVYPGQKNGETYR